MRGRYYIDRVAVGENDEYAVRIGRKIGLRTENYEEAVRERDRLNGVVTIEGVERDLEQEPCGCFACDDGVQPDHFKCEQPNAYMLRAEKAGLVSRAYTDKRTDGSRGLSSAWRWFTA